MNNPDNAIFLYVLVVIAGLLLGPIGRNLILGAKAAGDKVTSGDVTPFWGQVNV